MSLNSMRLKKGHTLLEVLIAVAMASVLAVSAAALLDKIMHWVQHSRLQNQMATDARMAIDSLTHSLQQGRANSVVICSCGATSCAPSPCPGESVSPPAYPPYSRIEFVQAGSLAGGTTNYAIYWENNQVNLKIGSYPARLVADHATSVMFTGDSTYPGLIYVSLRLGNYGATPELKSVTFLLSGQAVRMQTQ